MPRCYRSRPPTPCRYGGPLQRMRTTTRLTVQPIPTIRKNDTVLLETRIGYWKQLDLIFLSIKTHI
ncbi:hypothetical protein CAEBREN_30741 [Caenorhabditis brenneri]|uniref:Uncharacterized protein n=1 Tax=Caenorhabditis brenneri TaxID=135651 RepID=G0P7L5_CAEBE|nr:hypothetical protein CAEBREN_30741 [Caenorhabditis brenneri]